MSWLLGGFGCLCIIITQTATSKLPGEQAPQLRRTIPNSQPLGTHDQVGKYREVVA